MGVFDKKYSEIISEIIKDGVWDKDQNVRPKWADGTPAYTKSLICKQIVLDNSEVPILTTKKVAWKAAIHELLWFYVKRTSDSTYLKENKVKIWDEWIRKDGTIGKAYGYQLGKKIKNGYKKIFKIFKKYKYTNQVHKLIDGLKKDPASRRHIISLWNIYDLWDMALYPCVWHCQVLVKQNKANLIVGIRSNDMGLGNPFNVFQYYVLLRMIAHVTGLEVGNLIFNINDCHIYERHIESLKMQITREDYEVPKLWINPEVKNFDDFTIDDFMLVNPKLTDEEIKKMTKEEAINNFYYKCHDSIKMEVAI